MDTKTVDAKVVELTLARLQAVRDEAPEAWEKAVVDIGLSVLARGGLGAVRSLDTVLAAYATGGMSVEGLTRVLGQQLSLREASSFLASLENGEADRAKRSHELLQKILKVAIMVAEELLKAVLGGQA